MEPTGEDRILLRLATGTGKTAIAFQIAWKLFHSRWNLTDWRDGVPAGEEPNRRPYAAAASPASCEGCGSR
jgi:type I restriction enzyme, R subunit